MTNGNWAMIKASTGNRKASLMPCYAGFDLPLADGIDAGDVIDALDAVLIALMNGIDAYKAGASLRAGGFANADRVAHRAGLGEAPAPGLIAGALAQVVQVRDGQLGQALITGSS
jgi:hypothetical protein